MARPIVFKHHAVSNSHVSLGIGTFILCAFALFMCTSHSRKWRKWRACYGYEYQEPVIQLNPQENPFYHFDQDVDPTTYTGDQGPVWKKNILMGGKCQLPDFSGVIMYDSTGNVVTPNKPQLALPALPWK